MSPADWIERLRREVQSELERLDRVLADLAEALPSLVPDCPGVVRTGVAAYLHAFYTGCEAAATELLICGYQLAACKELCRGGGRARCPA